MIVSPSESLSSFKTSSCEPVFVTVASSLTLSVSLTALGELFDAAPPITVNEILAVVVAVPSDNV